MAEPFKKSDKEKAGVSIEPQPLKIGYGLALNIQPEEVAAALYDLKTGQLLADTSVPNALRSFGDCQDSLIAYAENDRKALQLTSVLREQVFDLMLEVLKQAEEKAGDRTKDKTRRSWLPQDVYYVAVAGTTLMQHIFAAMNPSGLGKMPPRPVSLFGEEILAEPTMYFCPCLSASIGGDIIAAQLALETHPELTSQEIRPTIKTRNEAALLGAGMALQEAGRRKLREIAERPCFGKP